MNRKECPECSTFETEKVHVEWYSNFIEETRICGDCDLQFTISYDYLKKEIDDVP